MSKEKYAVETAALTKVYKGKAAVDHLNLQVKEGAVYGFIGRNGAGKSTTLKMLCGLLRPTEGDIRLFEKPVGDPMTARRTGCLIEATGIYPHMTAQQNLILKAKCMGLADRESVEHVMSITGLTRTGSKKTKHFSMGMKQRLGIALALLGNPDLLILDEPINGLDPEGIREIRQLFLELNQQGKTLIISSHILGELSKIATHYGIIREGCLAEQLSREDLEKKCSDYFQVQVDDVKRALTIAAEKAPALRTEVCDNQTLRVYGLKEGAWLNQLFVESRIQVYSSGFHHMDLEEYFLSRMDGMEANGKETGKND
ncbi:MAG: ABC transporter ATP-binding protein [Acetatifactor sp.]|nr:ABC transporter ATP-binding protein [Acetatifactor sp.]